MEVEGRAEQTDPKFALPASLMRRYEVIIRPRAKAGSRRLREISADSIGALVTFRGIVTQVGGWPSVNPSALWWVASSWVATLRLPAGACIKPTGGGGWGPVS